MALKWENYIIKDDILVLNGKFLFFDDLADIKAGRPHGQIHFSFARCTLATYSSKQSLPIQSKLVQMAHGPSMAWYLLFYCLIRIWVIDID